MYVILCRSVSGAARLRSMWGRRRDPDSPLYSLVCLVCLKLQAELVRIPKHRLLTSCPPVKKASSSESLHNQSQLSEWSSLHT